MGRFSRVQYGGIQMKLNERSEISCVLLSLVFSLFSTKRKEEEEERKGLLGTKENSFFF